MRVVPPVALPVPPVALAVPLVALVVLAVAVVVVAAVAAVRAALSAIDRRSSPLPGEELPYRLASVTNAAIASIMPGATGRLGSR